MSELTDGAVWTEGLVVEAEDLGDIAEIRVLNYESPLRVIQPIVQVGYGDLHSPVVLVVHLHMPVHPHWTHVIGALQQRPAIFSSRVYSHHTPITPVFRSMLNFLHFSRDA